MKLSRRERHQERGALSPFGQGAQSPFNQLSRIRNEINRIFEDPFGFATAASTFFEGWTPAVDVYEDKDEITVRAELPGMKKEDIEVTVVGDTLTISGERKHEEEKKEGEVYRSERYLGRFQRSVTLPTEVDPNKVQATYKDGVLTVTLPKSEQAKRKQIEIKTT
jgi:HSP20 family protein